MVPISSVGAPLVALSSEAAPQSAMPIVQVPLYWEDDSAFVSDSADITPPRTCITRSMESLRDNRVCRTPLVAEPVKPEAPQLAPAKVLDPDPFGPHLRETKIVHHKRVAFGGVGGTTE